MGNQEIRYRLSATRKGQQFPTSSCQEFLSHWNLGLTCRGVGEKGRKAKEGGERGFLPFFTNTTPRRCRSLLPPCVIVCAHMPPTSSVPSPAPTVSSWHWCLVLYFSFFSLFVFFFSFPSCVLKGCRWTFCWQRERNFKLRRWSPRQVGDTINAPWITPPYCAQTSGFPSWQAGLRSGLIPGYQQTLSYITHSCRLHTLCWPLWVWESMRFFVLQELKTWDYC